VTPSSSRKRGHFPDAILNIFSDAVEEINPVKSAAYLGLIRIDPSNDVHNL